MIKPEDLRIGNLVTDAYYESFKTIIKVDSINEKGIDLFIDDDGNYPECRQEWIECNYTFDLLHGIPLTEKILLDCGFKHRSHLEDYFIELSDNCILSVTLDGVTFICGSNQQRILLPMTKHLHDLQNIFYSLTKTELIIKL